MAGHVAFVAGGTRGGGRGIATELGAAGATVYVTGRSTRAAKSDLDRPETIEDTAEYGKDPHFAHSETPAFLGRAVVALATDPDVLSKTGQSLATWDLAEEYGFTDRDGSQPHWGRYFRHTLAPQLDTVVDGLTQDPVQ
nr:hypothetical protein [Actinopolyspora alba]